MQTTTTNAPVKPADGLAAQLLAEGWQEGAPIHVDQDTQDIDRRIAECYRCPQCRKRGLRYRPLHQGRRYRVVAECACGHAEEL